LVLAVLDGPPKRKKGTPLGCLPSRARLRRHRRRGKHATVSVLPLVQAVLDGPPKRKKGTPLGCLRFGGAWLTKGELNCKRKRQQVFHKRIEVTLSYMPLCAL